MFTASICHAIRLEGEGYKVPRGGMPTSGAARIVNEGWPTAACKVAKV